MKKTMLFLTLSLIESTTMHAGGTEQEGVRQRKQSGAPSLNMQRNDIGPSKKLQKPENEIGCCCEVFNKLYKWAKAGGIALIDIAATD